MSYYHGISTGSSSSWAAQPSSSRGVVQPATIPPPPPTMSMSPPPQPTLSPALTPIVRPWSRAEDKVFENALVVYPENMPNRWAFIAAQLPGRTMEEVWEHYQALVADVDLIERGLVEFPKSWEHEDNSARAATVRRRTEDLRCRGIPWSEEEHRLFLEGLNKYGKGDWRNISRWAVKTRTPTQVASHAQKYFLRQATAATRGDNKRKSIHDITATSTDGNNNNNNNTNA